MIVLLIVRYSLNANAIISLYALSLNHKTLKNCIIALSRIQVPDNVLRVTLLKSRRITFATKKAKERSYLKSEDCKAKLEIRALQKVEAKLRFYKGLEKSDSVVIVGDFLLRKLAAQENTLNGLFKERKNSKEIVDYKERQEHLERIKRETVKALTLIRDL